MSSEERIPKILNNLQKTEGEYFVGDTQAILNEYRIQEENSSTLTIKILSIFGGIMAMIAFIAFLFVSKILESELALMISGLILIAAAVILTRLYDKILIDTLSLSAYITGMVMFLFGTYRFVGNENELIFMVLILALLTLFIAQSYMFSFLSVIIVAGTLIAFIMENNLYNLVHVFNALYASLLGYFIIHESKILRIHPDLYKLYNPVRIGLIFSLLMGLAALTFLKSPHFHRSHELYPWISTIPIGVVLLYLVKHLLESFGVQDKMQQRKIYTICILIIVASFFAPAILGALLLVLLCFKVNYKTGFGIGLIGLVYFISQNYYDLHYTLLTKSIMLLITGVLFLVLYFFMIPKKDPHEEV